MKDIGLKFKERREENGIDIEEVSSDLKLNTCQIEWIENGDKDSFKDVFELKSILSSYAKYLGLDSEKIIDEFNEYMFDCTSKISVDEINDAINSISDNKVSSPYTKVRKWDKKLIIFVGICIIIIVMVFILCMILRG